MSDGYDPERPLGAETQSAAQVNNVLAAIDDAVAMGDSEAVAQLRAHLDGFNPTEVEDISTQ